MIAFLSEDLLAKPFGRLLQWLDDHHVFLILPLCGVLLSLGVFGYVHFRTPPEPQPFVSDAEKGDYYYVDVQLLSDWLLKITGSGYDCFYLAVGTDGTLCIVSMNDVIHEEFAAVAEYGSADPAEVDVLPQPCRAEGVVKPMTQENLELLAEALDTTEEQYRTLVGGNYLDLRHDPNGDLIDLFVYVLGASVFLLLLNALTAFGDRRERRSSAPPRT